MDRCDRLEMHAEFWLGDTKRNIHLKDDIKMDFKGIGWKRMFQYHVTKHKGIG